MWRVETEFNFSTSDGRFLGGEARIFLGGTESPSTVRGWNLETFIAHNKSGRKIPTAQELAADLHRQFKAGELRLPPGGSGILEVFEQPTVCRIIHRLGAGGNVIVEEGPFSVTPPK